MRIAVLTSSFPRFKGDGTAPFVKSISEAIANLGNEVQVLAPYDISLRDDLESTVKVHRFKYVWPKSLHIMGHARTLQADVKLHPLTPLLLPLFLFAEIINLIRLSKKMNAQVIHAHWALPNGFAAAVVSKLLGIPLVISLHGSDIFMADKNFIFRAIARWTFKQSSAVTACSQELYDRAKRIHKNIDIHLIPWGADPDVFKPLQNRQDVRKAYGWASDEIIISTLGRMVYKKGFSHLIDIVPELISGDRRIKVVFGGSGPLEEELKEKVHQMGISNIVSFPGRIPWNEVPQFLAASDIFVLPSQRDKAGNLDGLPTVLLEAMACGLPCVASDVGGVSLVIRDGMNGFLVQPSDKDALSEKLGELINHQYFRHKMGHTARESIIEEFNWKRVAGKMFAIFQSTNP
jgi:glycosyltransferase involved in cell wall biosynthesis